MMYSPWEPESLPNSVRTTCSFSESMTAYRPGCSLNRRTEMAGRSLLCRRRKFLSLCFGTCSDRCLGNGVSGRYRATDNP
jgi:hypothetical protein